MFWGFFFEVASDETACLLATVDFLRTARDFGLGIEAVISELHCAQINSSLPTATVGDLVWHLGHHIMNERAGQEAASLIIHRQLPAFDSNASRDASGLRAKYDHNPDM